MLAERVSASVDDFVPFFDGVYTEDEDPAVSADTVRRVEEAARSGVKVFEMVFRAGFGDSPDRTVSLVFHFLAVASSPEELEARMSVYEVIKT